MRLLSLLLTVLCFGVFAPRPALADEFEIFDRSSYTIGGSYDRSEFENYPPIFDERLLNLVKPIEVLSSEGYSFDGLLVVGETKPGTIDWAGLAFYYPMSLSRRAETLLAVMELFETDDVVTIGELDYDLMGNLVFQLPDDVIGTIASTNEGIIAMWGDRTIMNTYMGSEVGDLTEVADPELDTMTMYTMDVLDVAIELVEYTQVGITGFSGVDLHTVMDESNPRFIGGGYDEDLGYEVFTYADTMAFEGNDDTANVHVTLDEDELIDFIVVSLDQPAESELDLNAFNDQVETWLYDWVYDNFDYVLVSEDNYIDPYAETSWSLDPNRELWLILGDDEGDQLMLTRDEQRVMLILYSEDDFEGTEEEEIYDEMGDRLEA